MAAETAKRAKAVAETAGLARRVPTQRRSRERYDRILTTAAQVVAEKGGDAFRMSDIVERAGVPFGSLYQYFPDKTAIIGTLAERCNAIGRACVTEELASVETVQDLHAALCRIVDGYYRMFIDEPVMRDIWRATQADKALQDLDEADMKALAAILRDALKRLAPEQDALVLGKFSQLIMHLIAAAVRHAITLERKDGDQIISMFKRMLPKDFLALTEFSTDFGI